MSRSDKHRWRGRATDGDIAQVVTCLFNAAPIASFARRVCGPHAVVLFSDSTITRNGTGVEAIGGGQPISYGNNSSNNNIGAEGTATAALATPPPERGRVAATPGLLTRGERPGGVSTAVPPMTPTRRA